MKIVIVFSAGFVVALIGLRQIDSSGILFYQGMVLSVLFSVLILMYCRIVKKEKFDESIKNCLLVFLLSYSFMFTIPTTVDRSYTVQMIGTLGHYPSGLNTRDVETMFVENFVRKGGVERRIEEQLKTGTIEINGDVVRLTRAGNVLNEAFKFSCRMFACKEIAKD